MRVVVISDTHIRRGSSRRLPDAAYRVLQGADAILHAGDIVVSEVLEELSGFAPTSAVLGNNDEPALAGRLPETLTVDLGGVTVAMVHDSGPAAGRSRRMRRLFPAAAVVVYGHSHIPFDGPGEQGQWLFNPGSPTERRSQPHQTVGVLDLEGGAVRHHGIVVVGP